jgi:hypothetical protein
MFVTFIFIIDIGPGLGYVGSKLFYDGLEMSQIASICDDFVKHSRRLNYDAQYMILSKMIIDIFMTFFSMICDEF